MLYLDAPLEVGDVAAYLEDVPAPAVVARLGHRRARRGRRVHLGVRGVLELVHRRAVGTPDLVPTGAEVLKCGELKDQFIFLLYLHLLKFIHFFYTV